MTFENLYVVHHGNYVLKIARSRFLASQEKKSQIATLATDSTIPADVRLMIVLDQIINTIETIVLIHKVVVFFIKKIIRFYSDLTQNGN
jgi:hypothetical protein